jgi:hypothetical protein
MNPKTIEQSCGVLQKPRLYGGNSVMRGLKVSMHRVFFVSGLTLALGAGTAGLRAQQSIVNPRTGNGQATVNGEASTSAGAQQSPTPDLANEQVVRMDQFLDDHKNIEKDLDSNPALINDTKYLGHHKDLESFLDANPRIRQQAQENPRYFVDRENRFDARGDLQSQNPRNPNPDLTHGELANFDGFLDSHPEISHQLDANPSLINDQNYLKANPDLETYLTQHPQVREELTETPNYFMNRENRLDAGDNGRLAPNQNNATAQEQDRMDQYLADHKDVDRDLRKNPRLIDDSGYLKHHRDLDEFLRANPDVRVLVISNPNYFQDRDQTRLAMTADARFDANGNHPLTSEQSERMDAFMDKHQKIARDLDRNPYLCNDDKYLSHHKDLRDFFDKNPGMRQQMAENRSYFEEREQRFEQHGAPVTKSPEQTPQQTQPTQSTGQKPAQAPVDQRQDMTPNTTH